MISIIGSLDAPLEFHRTGGGIEWRIAREPETF